MIYGSLRPSRYVTLSLKTTLNPARVYSPLAYNISSPLPPTSSSARHTLFTEEVMRLDPFPADSAVSVILVSKAEARPCLRAEGEVARSCRKYLLRVGTWLCPSVGQAGFRSVVSLIFVLVMKNKYCKGRQSEDSHWSSSIVSFR